MSNHHHPASDPIAAEVYRLAERLRRVLGEDYGDPTTDEVEVGWVTDFTTGEVVVAIAVGDVTYHEANRELICQREAHGRTEYARLGDVGEPGRWQVAAPPRRTSAQN